MPRDFSRTERVADFIQRELSVVLQQEMRDPRVHGVNINAVDVSRDLSSAKVYVTFWNSSDDAAASESVEVLNKAAGFLRTQLASSHSMRSTPRLTFYFDASVRTGERMEKLIAEANDDLGEDDQAQQED